MDPAGLGLRPERPRGAHRRRGRGGAEGDAPAERGHRALPGRDGGLAGRAAAAASGRRTSATGWRPTTAAARDILARLRAEGRSPARTSRTRARCRGVERVDQQQELIQLLDFMEARGEVAVLGREGRERQWDLASGSTPTTRQCRWRRRAAARHRATAGRAGHGPREGAEAPGSRYDVGEVGEAAWSRGSGARGASTRRLLGGRSRGAPRCCRRWTGWSSTASGWRSSSSSTTSSRCTSRRPSVGGATGRCRSCTGTGWSGRSTRRPTGRPGCCASPPSTRTCRSTSRHARPCDAELDDLADWLGLEVARSLIETVAAPTPRGVSDYEVTAPPR